MKPQFYRYQIPMTIGGHREGLLVKIGESYGEIAPLGGWSKETMDDVIESFREGKIPDYPSVRFGMESAIDQLEGRQKEISFTPTKLIREKPSTSLSGPIKVKLGHHTLSDAVDIINSLLDQDVSIRVDLNQKWHLAKTISFCKHFNPSDILYLEDPTDRYEDLELFYKKTGFHFALDQYLITHPLQTFEGLTHLIIKPSLHGGYHSCKKIVENAGDLECVFSSSYETSIGLSYIAWISHMLAPGKPVGIDTLNLLEHDIVDAPSPLYLGISTPNHPISFKHLEAL